MGDIRVERMHGSVAIYDRYGGGWLELTEREARHVRDRLDSILEDDDG